MSSYFSNLPTRANGQTVDASWWNSIKAVGVLVEGLITALVGDGGSTAEEIVQIGNNETGENVVGLIASDEYRLTRVKYWVRRVATDVVMEAGELLILYDGTNFHLGRHSIETSTTAGMSFAVNASTGQVTYDSSNMAGSYDVDESLMGFTFTTQGTI